MGIGCVCFFYSLGSQCLYLHRTLFRPLFLSISASFFIIRIYFFSFVSFSFWWQWARWRFSCSSQTIRNDQLLKKELTFFFCIAICVFFIRLNVFFLDGSFFRFDWEYCYFFIIQKYITIHIDPLTMAFFRYYNCVLIRTMNGEPKKKTAATGIGIEKSKICLKCIE